MLCPSRCNIVLILATKVRLKKLEIYGLPLLQLQSLFEQEFLISDIKGATLRILTLVFYEFVLFILLIADIFVFMIS